MSPILLARILGTKFGGPGATLTLGSKGEHWPYSTAINIASDWGNDVVQSNVDEVVFDKKNKIFSTPAYMYGKATPH
jgi:enhancing lycopene biosynthesis protein 2